MKFKSFSIPKDLYIFILIPIKIIYFRQRVNKLGYNSFLCRFEGNNFTKKADIKFLARLNKYYKASSFFLAKIFKDPNPCMIRSLILYELCAKNNIRAILVTGVKKNMGDPTGQTMKGCTLAGHSWLNINGKPFNENINFIKDFTVISEV